MGQSRNTKDQSGNSRETTLSKKYPIYVLSLLSYAFRVDIILLISSAPSKLEARQGGEINITITALISQPDYAPT